MRHPHLSKGSIVFGIEFNEKNLPKILQTPNITVGEVEALSTLFINKNYIFIRGYYDDRNRLADWAIMPWFIFRDNFDYNLAKMQSDWDQIVRL